MHFFRAKLSVRVCVHQLSVNTEYGPRREFHCIYGDRRLVVGWHGWNIEPFRVNNLVHTNRPPHRLSHMPLPKPNMPRGIYEGHSKKNYNAQKTLINFVGSQPTASIDTLEKQKNIFRIPFLLLHSATDHTRTRIRWIFTATLGNWKPFQFFLSIYFEFHAQWATAS